MVVVSFECKDAFGNAAVTSLDRRNTKGLSQSIDRDRFIQKEYAEWRLLVPFVFCVMVCDWLSKVCELASGALSVLYGHEETRKNVHGRTPVRPLLNTGITSLLTALIKRAFCV